jgi:hypothetical protein
MPQVVTLAVSFDAVTSGTLIEERGCLFLQEAGSPRPTFLIWPQGFGAVWRGDRLVVTDSAGAVFAEVGGQVTVGGGRLGAKHVAKFTEPDATGLCGASRYWVVSAQRPDPEEAGL